MGPGSAQRHEECRTASGTRDPFNLMEINAFIHELVCVTA
jgi:hypothetical protein